MRLVRLIGRMTQELDNRHGQRMGWREQVACIFGKEDKASMPRSALGDRRVDDNRSPKALLTDHDWFGLSLGK